LAEKEVSAANSDELNLTDKHFVTGDVWKNLHGEMQQNLEAMIADLTNK
jgi:hypothetical protein